MDGGDDPSVGGEIRRKAGVVGERGSGGPEEVGEEGQAEDEDEEEEDQ